MIVDPSVGLRARLWIRTMMCNGLREVKCSPLKAKEALNGAPTALSGVGFARPLLLYFAEDTVQCGSGEIGRHTILRGWRRKA